ncbi:MAG: heme-copper oxidase subunit III [Candidatus Tectimicrobiota bacterium]
MARDTSMTAVMEGPVDDAATLRPHAEGPPPFFPDPPQGYGDGDRHGDDEPYPGAALNNACLGMLIFLGAETMFFVGLIGAFLVFRLAIVPWPPTEMPRLPIEVTGVNTLILLYSALTMWRANRAVRTGQQRQVTQVLLLTGLLGLVFVLIQGYEWLKLIRFGLTLSSGMYGATFYTLIGCHALHVLGAVLWVGLVWFGAMRGRYTVTRRTGVVLCGMYWYYVVGLWPVLYWLVYLY